MNEVVKDVLSASVVAFLIVVSYLGIMIGLITGGGELLRSKNHDPHLGVVYTGSLFSDSNKQCFGPALVLMGDSGVFAVVQNSKECTP